MTSDLQDQILTKIANKMRVAIDEAVMEPWKYKPNFKIHDESVVDGATWYTVGCYDDTSQWLRTQDQKLWHEHINNKLMSSLCHSGYITQIFLYMTKA